MLSLNINLQIKSSNEFDGGGQRNRSNTLLATRNRHHLSTSPTRSQNSSSSGISACKNRDGKNGNILDSEKEWETMVIGSTGLSNV